MGVQSAIRPPQDLTNWRRLFSLLVVCTAFALLFRRAGHPPQDGDSVLVEILRPAGAGTAAATRGHAASALKHVYVVGCGHSGTSLLKRTLANLPGLHCIPKESQLFARAAITPAQRRKQLADWDSAAAAAGFEGWVEKSPKHVGKLEAIWGLDPAALVVLVVRDVRDVVASLMERGYTFDQALDRWVLDNSVALRHLEHPQLLSLRYEDLASEETVAGELGRLAEFAGVQAPLHRLLMALQPPSRALAGGEQCGVYASEDEKEADLAASYLQMMGQAKAGCRAGAEEEGPPDPKAAHGRYRSWQSAQPWAPQGEAPWRRRLDPQLAAAVVANKTAARLLKQFGYEL